MFSTLSNIKHFGDIFLSANALNLVEFTILLFAKELSIQLFTKRQIVHLIQIETICRGPKQM